MSQPVLPAPVTAANRAALGLDPPALARIQARAASGLCVLGLRFSNDKGAPAERFASLRRELGGAFQGTRSTPRRETGTAPPRAPTRS